MNSAGGDLDCSGPGFPIRISQDQSLFGSSPGLNAAYHVLHRLITPRHSPCTLSSLATFVAGPGRWVPGSLQRPPGARDPDACSQPPWRKQNFTISARSTTPMHLSKSRLVSIPGEALAASAGFLAPLTPLSASLGKTYLCTRSQNPMQALSRKNAKNSFVANRPPRLGQLARCKAASRSPPEGGLRRESHGAGG